MLIGLLAAIPLSLFVGLLSGMAFSSSFLKEERAVFIRTNEEVQRVLEKKTVEVMSCFRNIETDIRRVSDSFEGNELIGALQVITNVFISLTSCFILCYLYKNWDR